MTSTSSFFFSFLGLLVALVFLSPLKELKSLLKILVPFEVSFLCSSYKEKLTCLTIRSQKIFTNSFGFRLGGVFRGNGPGSGSLSVDGRRDNFSL